VINNKLSAVATRACVEYNAGNSSKCNQTYRQKWHINRQHRQLEQCQLLSLHKHSCARCYISYESKHAWNVQAILSK